jgi:diadenosine tetraphosphatase ApaH/serine/threonine PP2A family protein phosphatase
MDPERDRRRSIDLTTIDAETRPCRPLSNRGAAEPSRPEVFAELPDAVQTVVCGHTHMPFTRLVDRRLVVNPGSIGMPYGRAGGHWALLQDGGTTLRRTNLDIDAAIARVVAESDYPDRRTWADDYLRATSSDASALTSFAPRDGRPPS